MSDNDELLEEIIKACRDSVEPIKKSEVQELTYLLQELNSRVTDMVDKYSGQSEKSKEYWTKLGFRESYLIKGSYPELLEIITKILDILRGSPLEILIQKNLRNSKGEIIGITTYRGRESNLAVENKGKYREVQYDLNESLKNIQKIQKGNEAFIQHYSQFYNIAQEHIKSTRGHGKNRSWKKKINEGNIVEAFQRHMQLRHLNSDIETDNFTEEITPREVIILLYYSLGNIPWWQQGDIGYLQVKSNNLRLATYTSIRRVATKIKMMFQDLEHFDVEEFKTMFTAQDQKELVDYDQLTEEEYNNLINDIRKNSNFKGVTITDLKR